MHFFKSSKLLLRFVASSVPLLCLLLVAEAFVTGRESSAADECVAKPTGAAPQGQHWYYRVDRVTKNQCWYLAAEGTKVRAPARLDPKIAASSTRKPAPKPIVQPLPEETVDEALPVTKAGDPAEKNPPALASIDWRALSTSSFATTGEALLPNPEKLLPESTDDLRVPTPIPAETQPAAEDAPQLAIGFLLAVLGSALGIAGIVYLFVRLAASQPKRREHTAVKPTPAPKQPAAKPASLGLDRAETAQPRIHPATQPDLHDIDVEISVRRLLQELVQRQRELTGATIPVERPAVSRVRSANHRPISSARLPD
jgi:hypothetical protein